MTLSVNVRYDSCCLSRGYLYACVIDKLLFAGIRSIDNTLRKSLIVEISIVICMIMHIDT